MLQLADIAIFVRLAIARFLQRVVFQVLELLLILVCAYFFACDLLKRLLVPGARGLAHRPLQALVVLLDLGDDDFRLDIS